MKEKAESGSPSPEDNGGSRDDGDDFEFAFSVGDREAYPFITADEIFSDGQIRPCYPVFNRDLLRSADEEKARRSPLLQLLIEDRNQSISPSSSSFGGDLEGVPAGTYCVWSPSQSPGRVRKSSSTGSSFRWRIRDFMVGRSHSDGKEKFVFLADEKSSADEGKGKGKEKKPSEIDLLDAHRMFYGRSGNGSSMRKSYLPYKPEIVGFLSSGNGICRMHHPC